MKPRTRKEITESIAKEIRKQTIKFLEDPNITIERMQQIGKELERVSKELEKMGKED